jgi:hypothetical protein
VETHYSVSVTLKHKVGDFTVFAVFVLYQNIRDVSQTVADAVSLRAELTASAIINPAVQ